MSYQSLEYRIVDTRSGSFGGLQGVVGPIMGTGWFVNVPGASQGGLVHGTVTATGWLGAGDIVFSPNSNMGAKSNLNYGGTALTAIASGFTCTLVNVGGYWGFYMKVEANKTQVIIDVSGISY